MRSRGAVRVVVATAIVAIVGSMAPRAASAATASLKASPSTNLADDQEITVTAAGYPAHVTLDLVPCSTVYGCDLRNVRLFNSGSSGGFTTKYFVSRIIHPGSHTVDCAKLGHCVLVSINISTLVGAAETAITFDPNKPILPPLSISMSLDGTDGVVVSSGVAILHGNVTCNRAAEIYIYSNIRQTQSGAIYDGYGNTEVECTGAQTIPWQLSINPQTHNFVTGAAQVYANADGQTNNSSDYVNTNGTVILASANLPTLIPSTAHVTVPAAGSTVVLHYWILLSAASQFPVSFQYSTLNGTASAPADYVTTSGFVTMPAGTTKAIVPITINGNNESPGSRNFIVSLTNPSNAQLGANHGRGTVTLVHS